MKSEYARISRGLQGKTRATGVKRGRVGGLSVKPVAAGRCRGRVSGTHCLDAGGAGGYNYGGPETKPAGCTSPSVLLALSMKGSRPGLIDKETGFGR